MLEVSNRYIKLALQTEITIILNNWNNNNNNNNNLKKKKKIIIIITTTKIMQYNTNTDYSCAHSLEDYRPNQLRFPKLSGQPQWMPFICFRRPDRHCLSLSGNICTHQSFQFGDISQLFFCWDTDRRLTPWLTFNLSRDFYYWRYIINKNTNTKV